MASKRRVSTDKRTIGKPGPVRILGNGKLVYALLRTSAQVKRADNLSQIAHGLDNDDRKQRMRYPARPYMGPALQTSREHLAPVWRDSIR